MARRRAALVSRHSRSNEPVPSVGPASSPGADLAPRQADFGGDLCDCGPVEGQEDDGGALPEMRGGRGGVAERAEDVVLTFGDGDLGRLTRHGESLPGDCESGEAG